MASDEPEDLEALRRRVAVLEAMLETILGADVAWSELDADFPSSRKYRKDRSRRPSDQMYYLIDRYYHRRERAFFLTLDRIEELRSVQSGMARELAEMGKVAANQAEQTKREIASLDALTRSGAAELHQWLAIQTLGLTAHETRVTRYLPMRAYLSDIPENGLGALTDAIDRFIETFGFEVSDEFPEVRGSWFKKWFVRTKEAASQPEVAERLAKVERALEMKGLGTPQAEIDSKQAGAIAALITSLVNVPSAAIQVGSILFLKLTIDGQAVVQARTLTQRELIVLENNQDLLNSPTTIMTKLAKLCSKEAPSFKGSLATGSSPTLSDALDIWGTSQANRGKKRDPENPPAILRLPHLGSEARDLSDDDKLE